MRSFIADKPGLKKYVVCESLGFPIHGSTSSAARMRFAIYSGNSLVGKLQIYLSGTETTVTQKFLNGPDVRTILTKMCCV